MVRGDSGPSQACLGYKKVLRCARGVLSCIIRREVVVHDRGESRLLMLCI